MSEWKLTKGGSYKLCMNHDPFINRIYIYIYIYMYVYIHTILNEEPMKEPKITLN